MNGAILKILAVVFMTADHVGMVLFPQYIAFRKIGRLAFPIFAYMVAEGCRYTRSMPRYWGLVTAVAAVCQVAYFVAMDSLYQCIFVTFSLSIGLIWLIKVAQNKGGFQWALPVLGLVAVFFVTEVLPAILSNTDYAVDYGFLGVMLPVAVYLGKHKWEKLLLASVVLVALALDTGTIQFYALLSVPLLALYNGKRGWGPGKYFFYIYYPVHLLVIEGLAFLL